MSVSIHRSIQDLYKGITLCQCHFEHNAQVHQKAFTFNPFASSMNLTHALTGVQHLALCHCSTYRETKPSLSVCFCFFFPPEFETFYNWTSINGPK